MCLLTTSYGCQPAYSHGKNVCSSPSSPPPPSPLPPPPLVPTTHTVGIRFSATGDPSDYDANMRVAILDVLAGVAGLSFTAGATLTVTPGSVIVTASFPFASAASAEESKSYLNRNLPDRAALQSALTFGGVVIEVISAAVVSSSEVGGGEEAASTGVIIWWYIWLVGLLLMFMAARICAFLKRRSASNQRLRQDSPFRGVDLSTSLSASSRWPVIGGTAARPAAVVSTVINATVVDAPAMPPTSMQLSEMVEVLKQQLGVSGNHMEVVHQSAKELGIATATAPLVAIAERCMQALGEFGEGRRQVDGVAWADVLWA